MGLRDPQHFHAHGSGSVRPPWSWNDDDGINYFLLLFPQSLPDLGNVMAPNGWSYNLFYEGDSVVGLEIATPSPSEEGYYIPPGGSAHHSFTSLRRGIYYQLACDSEHPASCAVAAVPWVGCDARIPRLATSSGAGSRPRLRRGGLGSLQGPRLSGVCEGWITGPSAAPGDPIPVVIESAEVTQDRIVVSLSAPQGTSGTLTLQLDGPSVDPHVIRAENRGVGTHNETFNITQLPDHEFTEVIATWAVGGQNPSATYSYHIKVLGNFQNSQYNTPTESYCSGSLVPLGYTAGTSCNYIPNCNLTDFQAKSEWQSEAWENGSGLSQTLGMMSLEWLCDGPVPTMWRKVPQPCPSCGGTLTVGTPVAVRHPVGDLECGASLYVHGVGTVTVADTGAKLAANQLDHYVGTSGCNKYAGNLGSRKVIRIFSQ